ncbi:MAG: beta-lactamase family protein [Chitinophagaceae bacterium]|nr:beta-lactamase family protein [Chitinophagaceae bacterium]
MKNWILFVLVLMYSHRDIQAQVLYFPPNTGNSWDTISPNSLQWCQPQIDSLYAFLDTNKTKAFILLKDGKIVLEKYFNGHNANLPWYWASAGKTITAFMVGLAQQQNNLSITDTTSNYLGNGWTNCTLNQERAITLRHQLTMTSGLDDGVPDHYCTIDTCLNYLAPPGTRWAYHNGPYTLLDSVVQIATGMSYNNFLTQGLKNPTGMTGSVIPNGFNRVFYSTARSMARFGLLILNKGNWNGNPVMTDTNYFNAMLNTSQPMNLSYGYLWWLNGKASFMLPQVPLVINGPIFPNAPSDVVAAMGKNGQFLNVCKSQNLVWLRMGDSPDTNDVPFLLNDKIWSYINQLPCNALSNAEMQLKPNIQLWPNPGSAQVELMCNSTIEELKVYNITQTEVARVNPTSPHIRLSTTHWAAGIYVFQVRTQTGDIVYLKWMKQ